MRDWIRKRLNKWFGWEYIKVYTNNSFKPEIRRVTGFFASDNTPFFSYKGSVFATTSCGSALHNAHGVNGWAPHIGEKSYKTYLLADRVKPITPTKTKRKVRYVIK